MKLTKSVKIIFLAAAVCCATALSSCGSETKTIKFGTGNMGGNYYSYGNALVSLIEETTPEQNFKVRTTSGSAANLRLMQKGFLDLAIVQSDTLRDAVTGSGDFSGNECSGVRAVAGLYTEECQIIVKADSDIYSVNDLYGKNVSVGEEESGVKKNAEQILSVNGISFKMINPSYLSFSESADALENGSIDAFFCTAGSPTTAVTELSKNFDIRLVSLDKNTINKLLKEDYGYTACTIPAGTYKGQNEDIQTVGVKAVLIASKKLSDNAVRNLTDILFSRSSDLQYATSSSALTTDFAVSEIHAPFHKGAAEWYKEAGIDVSTEEHGKVNYGVNAAQD